MFPFISDEMEIYALNLSRDSERFGHASIAELRVEVFIQSKFVQISEMMHGPKRRCGFRPEISAWRSFIREHGFIKISLMFELLDQNGDCR